MACPIYSVDPSPDGNFLLVSWLEKPYSFNVPCGRFPQRTQLWDRSGSLVREIAALPLAEDIPIADDGDPSVEVSPRDVVYTIAAKAAENDIQPSILAKTDLRCGGVAWG
ncbi:hypothetical protein CEUSTIGMA_g3116.t1 [Chlamydomonas eustigma]|uniref:Uncharacterized protein n=1 Tax=Chlamydomonas eustigma TaxID=1157962 RepID=A0A250WXV9_9CHLO|nr:hypothetical protein CEUSTIGMA_g3116.t1 [Chlamydomonas eustigma]|eukprot:GAX75673.1 hypothetical protein CEUSTIGMA_g3116.t1 [Chlamydomonas eustigma]